MRTVLTIALLCIVLLVPPASAKDDPTKSFLLGIGKALKAGDAGGISKHFPSRGKVELRLKRIKAGNYRNVQARALLKTYLNGIEPKSYELKQHDRLVGEFKMKYRVRSDGTTVEGTTHVYLQKEGGSWLIVGIVES